MENKPKWLKDLSNEKLMKRFSDSEFNFTISAYLNNKPNYNEQDKAVMYKEEILRRLNEKEV